MCVKESCLQECWKFSLVVPVFYNVVERSTAKMYCPVSLLSEVSKVFEKLVNDCWSPKEMCHISLGNQQSSYLQVAFWFPVWF